MGKNNRARRAAKARDRKRRATNRSGSEHRQAPPTDDEPSIPVDELIDGLLDLAPVRLSLGNRQFAEQAARRLLDCPRGAVVRAIEGELTRAVIRLFADGWQPAEVVRQARRRGGPNHAALVATAVVAHHARSHVEPIDPRWQRQLDALAAVAVTDECRPDGWFADWSQLAALGAEAELMETFAVLVTLRSLPPVEQLVPPPGSSPVDRPGGAPHELSDDDHRLLERVRHLLEKAESTEFDAEAEAFTAKAHELITRHAIDTALIAGDAGPIVGDEPTSMRIEIDDPYADAKSLLLQIVAGGNRCRAIFHTDLAFSTVVGYPADLAATELLYTSLLVQAQTALAAAGRNAPPGARTRSRSYRSAFLVAYATRIGQRLDEISEHLVTASDGHAALPVLRSRKANVDDAVAARFPHTVSSAVRGGQDAAGWVGGRLAADQARLNAADLTGDDGVGGAFELPLALGR